MSIIATGLDWAVGLTRPSPVGLRETGWAFSDKGYRQATYNTNQGYWGYVVLMIRHQPMAPSPGGRVRANFFSYPGIIQVPIDICAKWSYLCSDMLI